MRAALAAFAMSGCLAGVPATAPRPAAPAAAAQLFGIPGEAFEYAVAWRGIRVGTVQVAVGPMGSVDGHRAVATSSRGRTAGIVALLGDIDWRLDTTLDVDAGRPLHGVEEIWVRSALAADVHARQERHFAVAVPEDDVHAAAARLRAWRGAPGARMRMRVAIDDEHFAVELWRAGRETISAPRPMPAIRYEGIVVDRARFAVWISDDEARVPLRVRVDADIGSIGVDLLEYDPPPEER